MTYFNIFTYPIVVQACIVLLLGGQEKDREEAQGKEDATSQPEGHRKAGPVIDEAADGWAKCDANAKKHLGDSDDLAGMPWSCL